MCGLWVSEPYQTQLGMATEELCFKQNGEYKSTFTSKGASMKDSGRYTVDGNQVSFVVGDQTSTESVSWDGDVLILQEKGGTRIRFHRKSLACERTDSLDYSTAIIGQWKDEPVVGQLGRGVSVLCFRADHTVVSRIETHAGVLSNHGTFSLSGDQVTFKWADGVEPQATARIEIGSDGQTMTFFFSNDSKTLFHRTENNC